MLFSCFKVAVSEAFARRDKVSRGGIALELHRAIGNENYRAFKSFVSVERADCNSVFAAAVSRLVCAFDVVFDEFSKRLFALRRTAYKAFKSRNVAFARAHQIRIVAKLGNRVVHKFAHALKRRFESVFFKQSKR